MTISAERRFLSFYPFASHCWQYFLWKMLFIFCKACVFIVLCLLCYGWQCELISFSLPHTHTWICTHPSPTIHMPTHPHTYKHGERDGGWRGRRCCKRGPRAQGNKCQENSHNEATRGSPLAAMCERVTTCPCFHLSLFRGWPEVSCQHWTARGIILAFLSYWMCRADKVFIFTLSAVCLFYSAVLEISVLHIIAGSEVVCLL